MKKSILSVLIIISLTACKKKNFFDCFESAGESVSLEVILRDFDSISVKNVFEIHFFQDTLNKMIIKGNKNIVDNMIYDVSENTLTLDNNHGCLFTKPEKKKIKLNIFVKSLKKITLNSPAKIICENKLKGEEIGLIFLSKLSEAELKLDYKTFYFWNNVPNGGKVNLSGNVNTLKIWNFSLCSVEANNLTAQNALIINYSYADCHVRAVKNLEFGIHGQGNIYYYGQPEIIDTLEITSKGKLIQIKE